MYAISIDNQQAAAAIYLAQVAHLMDRATLARQLARYNVPRGLYTLARVLRAATVKGF